MNSVDLHNYSDFSLKAKAYASQFNPCAILDSCDIQPQCQKGLYKLIIGWGGKIIEPKEGENLKSIYSAWHQSEGWLFGVLGYNLKNEIEKLSSTKHSCFNWPDAGFFVPEMVITITWDDKLTMHGANTKDVFDSIERFEMDMNQKNTVTKNSPLIADFNETDHYATIQKIKEQIRNGNVYELKLCSRFLYEKFELANPYRLYDELIGISPSPFSAYFALDNRYVLSASPERYLAKNGDTMVSQPIKGTRARGKHLEDDTQIKHELENSQKDRAENVMIVDLVRNDMARVAKAGTVKVEELFGIYSYSHVHQMVSTIISKLDTAYTWKDAIRATFPMGSMTGAPKIAAMNWIDFYEHSNREWFSGALGYIDPQGNMDFNVLIRSMFYDSTLHKIAYYAGGAITIDSDADEEYREMLLKAKAIDGLLAKYF